jgi:hypothetical protein
LQQGSRPLAQFEPALVAKLYSQCFTPSNDALHRRQAGPARPLQELELSSYLEQYLWPHFSVDASFEHVMSIVMVRGALRRRRRACTLTLQFTLHVRADGH